MISVRFTSVAMAVIASLSIVAFVLAQTRATAPAKRAKPPLFTKTERDVFFPDARAKLVGDRPASSARPAAVVGNVPQPAADANERSEAGTSSKWSVLISAETIEDEIKHQQIQLAQATANSAKFKGGEYRQARTQFSVLAVLFDIAAGFDGRVRWQREAATLRDLLAQAGFHCKVGTDAAFKEAKSRSDDLAAVVRGGSVDSKAKESADKKVADRAPLMKRLEQSQKEALAPWTANAGEFSKHAEQLTHDAELVAALAEVIMREGYEFADDDTYRQYARDMQTQALAIREAVAAKNYDQARQSAGELSKSCANCHEGYRN